MIVVRFSEWIVNMLNQLSRITILFHIWLLCSLGLLLSPLQMPLVDAEEMQTGDVPTNCSSTTSCCGEIEKADSSSRSTEGGSILDPLQQASCCQDASTGNSCNSSLDDCDHACCGYTAGIQHALTFAFAQIHPPRLNRLLPDTYRSDLANCWQETPYRPPSARLSV
jgi:hypothetical protein